MGSELQEFKLGDVSLIKSSKRIFAREYVDSGVPFWRSKDVIDKSFGVFNKYDLYISKERFYEISSKFGSPKKGDLLISSVGNRSGQPYIIQNEGDFYFKDGNIIWFSDFNGVNPKFLSYWLKSEMGQAVLSSVMIGSAQKALTIDSLRKLNVQFPKESYQNEAARLLTTIDNKIQLNRQTNQTLEQIAQALFKSWFVDFDPVIDNVLAAGNPIPGELQDRAKHRQQQLLRSDHEPLPDDIMRLFPSEFELTDELGWVPLGWEVQPLDKVAHYQNGLALQKFRPANEDDFLPVLKIAHLKQGFTDGKEKASLNIKASCIVDDGDVVFSWSGSLMVDVWCGGKAALNQHLFRVTSDIYPRWLYYHYTVQHLSNFQRIAADKAVTMGHIKREHLSQAICTFPADKLLKKMGNVIEPYLEKIVQCRKESNQLEKLRDTLLPKLISGELRLPAEALSGEDQKLS